MNSSLVSFRNLTISYAVLLVAPFLGTALLATNSAEERAGSSVDLIAMLIFLVPWLAASAVVGFVAFMSAKANSISRIARLFAILINGAGTVYFISWGLLA